MKKSFIWVFLTLVLWGLPASASQSPTGSPPTANSAVELLKQIGFEQHNGEQLPLDLEFFDENGLPVKLGQYFTTQPVIIVPVLLKCQFLSLNVLNGLIRSLTDVKPGVGQDFTVLVVTIDPRETTATAFGQRRGFIKRYGRPGSDPGWHFLTGRQPAIESLMKALGFQYIWNAEKQGFAHSGGIIITTPQGKISRYFFGMEYPAETVTQALSTAQAGRVGTLVPASSPYCFHYDPGTGKYTPVVLNLLKISAVVTVVALGLFLGMMLRSERHGHNTSEQRG